MKRMLWISVMALCTGLYLFAGGGGQAQKDGGVVTLKFTYWGSPVERQAVEAALRSFEQNNPGIKVDAQHIPTDYVPKITAMMAGNVSPDMGYLTNVVLDWGTEGRLVNILDLINGDPDITPDTFLDTNWYKWSATEAAGVSTSPECWALFYNKDLFTKAGVALPPSKVENAWTWDQFVAVSKQLTFDSTGKHPDDSGFNPNNIVQYGVQWPMYLTSYMNAVYSNNGKFLSDDGKTTKITSPEATEAIQKIADLVNVHHVSPSPAAAQGIPEISTALQTGKVAMVISGQWALLDLANNTNLNFDIGVLPVLKQYRTVIQGGCTVIFADTTHLKEAYQLSKWLKNPEAILPLIAGGLWMPLYKDWYTDEALISRWAQGNRAHPPSYRTAVMEPFIKYGIPNPEFNVKNFPRILNIITAALDPVWIGEKTAAQALKEAETQINAEVKGFYDTSRTFY